MPRRFITPEWWKTDGRVVLAVILAAICFGGTLTFVLFEQNANAIARCKKINALQGAIVTILDHSRVGLPANRYYRHHPDELRRALHEIGYDEEILASAHCNPN